MEPSIPQIAQTENETAREANAAPNEGEQPTQEPNPEDEREQPPAVEITGRSEATEQLSITSGTAGANEGEQPTQEPNPEDYSEIQGMCMLCHEPFSEDDDFQAQYIECSNCHRRWHPHPDTDERGQTFYCRCGTCHMFQNQLNSFDHVTDPEYLTGIGCEFIAERIRVNGPEHDAICKLLERNIKEMMKHSDYLEDYIDLTNKLNRFIEMATLIKEKDRCYFKTRNQIEEIDQRLQEIAKSRSKASIEERKVLKARRDEINEHYNSLVAQVQEFRSSFSYYDVEFNREGRSRRSNALELIVNAFHYGIVIRNIRPTIYINPSDIDVVIKNRDDLVSIYPSIFEIPPEFIRTFNTCERKFEALFKRLIEEHYNQLHDSTNKLDRKYKRVGRCPTCEAAPVYIDENDCYRCAGCQARICKSCFKEISEGHACDPIDIADWNAIQEDTKACPNCGFRFGHHSRCNAMFCTNCYHGFNYTDLSEIKGWFDNAERDAWAKRMGFKNTHIVATFRQLPSDVQIEVAKNVGKNIVAPFSNLIGAISRFYDRNRNSNTFDNVKNAIISKTHFGEYKEHAVQILLCEILKEVIIDYTIEVLEICESINEGRNRTIKKLIDNEVDKKMNSAAENLATIIKRFYYMFPVARHTTIDEIETDFVRSIALYAHDTATMPNIAPMNDVFNVDDCVNMSEGLKRAYDGIRGAIEEKERNKPIILEEARSIDDVFNEYRRRFNLAGEINFQINLRRRYRNITHELIDGDDGPILDYIVEGASLSLEDAVNNNIRSVVDGVNGKPFKYADFVGKVISGVVQVNDEPGDEVQVNADLDDEALITILLRHYFQQIGVEYNRRNLSNVKILHRTFRNLRLNNEGFYLIEHRTERVPITFENFLTRRIMYQGTHSQNRKCSSR